MVESLTREVLAVASVLQGVDVALFRWINEGWAHPVLDPVMVLITQLGLGTVQIAVLALVYTFGGPLGRRVAFLCFLAYLVSGVAAQVLKYGVDRWRPVLVVEGCRCVSEVLRYHSFPSGHTASSFAIATVAAAHYRRLRVPLFLLAALVGVSRVYVGSHFPSDVLGSVLLGVATGIACLQEAAALSAQTGPDSNEDRGADTG